MTISVRPLMDNNKDLLENLVSFIYKYNIEYKNQNSPEIIIEDEVKPIIREILSAFNPANIDVYKLSLELTSKLKIEFTYNSLLQFNFNLMEENNRMYSLLYQNWLKENKTELDELVKKIKVGNIVKWKSPYENEIFSFVIVNFQLDGLIVSLNRNISDGEDDFYQVNAEELIFD